MRIYLIDPQVVLEKTKGGSMRKRSYPRHGFYANVPDDRASKWIDEGKAFEATDKNRVVAFGAGKEKSEVVDVDAGASLDGFTSRYVKPKPKVVPKPEAKPVAPVVRAGMPRANPKEEQKKGKGK